MNGALRISERPTLERPVLIAAFRGWNDGGQGASLATGYLAKHWRAERFADLDPEEFFDFQATRPTVRLEGGMTRRIDWPATGFYHARPGGSSGSAPPPRGTKDRGGSSGSCTTSAAGQASPPRASGRRFRTTCRSHR